MSPLFYVTQLEVLLANHAPPARIESVLINLRKHVEALENELDHLRGGPRKPGENTAGIPVVLGCLPAEPPQA
ncbi:MAG TPA: hypothetical protein VHM91_20980 [Verrucomicrobiales bacterium]|jgi:hypothetical protein|nr:hypothetical protein [Verrucomicrobiales bacterium]